MINDKNRERVARLDELADIANRNFTDVSRFTADDYERHINEVVALIYGEGEYHLKVVAKTR